jgi:CheY-like chemotaxis protein
VPQTLLLADDSATIQRVIELTFADEDIQVVVVSDGDQAIARLESAPPDIVLADVGMSGKSGYDVAEYVKNTPRLAHIPVVLLTGAFEPVDQVKAAAVGCDGVLAKPFEPQLVIGRVRELLGRAASADGAGPASARQVPAADPFAFEPAPPPPAESAAEPDPAAKVEDYFDRLDAAFGTLSNPPAAAPAAAAPVPEELDWLRPKEEPQAFAVAQEAEPVAVAAPELPVVAEPPAPKPIPVAAAAAPLEPREPEPVPPLEPLEPLERSGSPRILPSIADAFGAILAAEQNALGVRPEWPTPARPASSAASAGAAAEVVITDELVDRVARRALEQLSDRVVRETVASIASDVAERLVREEIERIKAAVK